jgi:predicted Zn-dependent peptidase
MYKKTKLNNGLRIIAHRMPQRQSLALGIWINTGGRYENSSNKGISHYLEHMLFKGTKKYTCRGIKESIEGVGGSLNGFTSEEFTCYLAKIPLNYLELALDVLSDMVLNPVLRTQEVTKEKTVILEELKMYRDQPQSYVYELLDELMWTGHPLGQPIIGYTETVNKITRQAIKEYKDKYYTPSNIVVSVAGEMDYDLLIKAISRRFSSYKQSGRNEFMPVGEIQVAFRLNAFDKATEQTHLALGFHALKRDHPLRYALGLLNVILGANMSSRLFDELREKRGLAYEIGSVVKRFQDTGAFLVHAGIDNRKVPDSIKIILDELYKCKEKLVTHDEFRRAKEFYLGQLMLGLEDTLDHMLWIGEYTAALDKTYTLQELIKEVNKATREDLRDIARLVFTPDKLSLALIGPVKKLEQEISKLLKSN